MSDTDGTTGGTELRTTGAAALPVEQSAAGTVGAILSRGLGSPQLGALLALAAGLTLGIGLIMWSIQPDYVPVSENASSEDMLQIVDHLRSQQLEFKIEPGSGMVLVPRDRLAEIRLQLAGTGLMKDPAVGIELLHEEPSLGISQFTETARYQHALETELSRTISSMRNIDSARVHLALPRQSVFIRDRVQPSASVMVKPQAGRLVEEEQVESIVNLVASSIAYLEADQVTVVDQWGRLLSHGRDGAAGETREQFRYTRKLEQLYADRIESLLTPVVGAGRLRVSVTADVDFSINERTQELFEPDPEQVRSEQTQEQISENAAPVGIPGALTNQPPLAGTVDENGNPVAPGTNGSQSSSATRNYELDKTITHLRQASSSIRRLSAAVILDDAVTTDADGNVVRTPVSDAQIEQYTALVREAIGFNVARGDTVVVMNQSFQPAEELMPVDPLPIWQQDWLWTMVRQVLTGLAVLLIVLMVLRPAMKRLMAPPPPEEEEEDEIDEDEAAKAAEAEAEANLTPQEKARRALENLENPSVMYGDILELAREMAAQDPRRVAMVVKEWVEHG